MCPFSNRLFPGGEFLNLSNPFFHKTLAVWLKVINLQLNAPYEPWLQQAWISLLTGI